MTKFGQEHLPHERVEWLGFDFGQFIQFETDINSKTSVFLDISSEYFTKSSPACDQTAIRFLKQIQPLSPQKYGMRVWNTDNYDAYGTISYLWNNNWINGYKIYLDGFNVVGLDWYVYNGQERPFLSVNGSQHQNGSHSGLWSGGNAVMQFGDMPLKIRSIEVQQDHVTAMNLVAAREGLVGCLYDEMNNTYYKNLGDGELEIGPDVRR